MRIGICGYGNLGKGVEKAIAKNSDMDLVAVFTRRDPDTIVTLTDVPVVHISKVLEWKEKIDVMIICAGSATDLPTMTPNLAEYFNVIDSYDNHSNAYNHYLNVDKVAMKSQKVALISCGWDPGMFSLNRLYSNAILPDGKDYTFWGRGVSQGHSDAIRRIEGVVDARQYTVPVEKALKAVRNGLNPELTIRDKHTRECFVVVEKGADKDKIREEIVNMPAYFADYDTSVTFISSEELERMHSGLPHGGSVIRTGVTNSENKQVIEYKINLDSNPEFTGSILIAFARAVYRMAEKKNWGCKTVFDIVPADLSDKSREELITYLL